MARVRDSCPSSGGFALDDFFSLTAMLASSRLIAGDLDGLASDNAAAVSPARRLG